MQFRGRSWFRNALVATVLAALSSSCGDARDVAPPPARVDVAAVLHEERMIVDPSRPTRVNGTAPGTDRRSLATRLWYAPVPVAAPACRGGRCAVVVFAHGLGGSTGRFDAMARALAAAGYIVAAPTFPLTHEFAPGGSINGVSDVAEQPADLSAVIDALDAAGDDAADPLHGRVDGTRVGALGHSLGGATVIAATRTACCGDNRIGAAVLVAPATFVVGVYFGGEPRRDGAPMLVVNGSDDPLIRPFASREYARSLAPPWYFLEVRDVGHSLLVENVGEPTESLTATARAVEAFFDEYLGGTAGTTVAALASLVAEGEDAEFDE